MNPERRVELEAFLKDAIPFYESPGGIAVRLLWSRDEPGRFIEVIEYLDVETFERDQVRVEQDPEMKRYLERWRELLSEPVSVEVFEY